MVRVATRVLPGLMLAVFLFAPSVLADSGTQSVSTALDRQAEWLAGSSNGAGWNEFLLTDVLRQELAKGGDASKRRVAQVLGRYESGLPGLEKAQFQATREQLTAWAHAIRVPMALRWAERVRASASDPSPIGAAQVRQAKLELIQALADLERFLATSTAANARAWKSFLKWDQLQRQLRANEPDFAQLNEVGEQYFDGYPGLERPPFVRGRNALRKYLFLLSLSGQAEDALQQGMESQRTALADAIEKYNDAPSVKAAGRIANLSDWLDQLGQISTLAAEMRSYHRRPNILVQVSEDFVARRFTDTVDETRFVDEMILGTRIRGNARTLGHVSADVVPNPQVARIDILLQGVTNTPSVGRQRPVTIHSFSRTNLQARKPLLVSPEGLTSRPAQAAGRTNSTIFRIIPDGHFGRRLVERIAWRRAMQQKPLAEQIASGRAARRVERQMDARTQEVIAEAKPDLQGELRRPLERRGLIPPRISSSSSDLHVFVQGTQANPTQFAARISPPAFAENQLVAALVHESMVNNTAEQAIAGLRLTDERIAQLVEEVTGSVPEELQLSDDRAPWSISFDWQQPLTVEFDDETMTVAVRGREFTNGDRTLSEVMEISATYSMQTSPSGVILTRQGDIEVDFPNQREGRRLSNVQIVFRSLMRNKFAALFKPEIQGEGFVLPNRWEAIGRLRLDELSTHDGWLSLGWN